MKHELTPLLKASISFAYVGGITFIVAGVVLGQTKASKCRFAPLDTRAKLLRFVATRIE